MKPIVEHLSNGLTVVLAESRAAQVISYQMWIGVGSADEKPKQAGLAHVLEHMLFKGTERRKVGQIAQDVENAGGIINAGTSFDYTVYHITLASHFRDQGLDILADAITNASLDSQELQKELVVILEEVRMGNDIPQRVVASDLFNTLFKRHPYGRPIIGYDETIKQFTQKKVRDFYKTWYVPSNMILVICGDFTPRTMIKKVERLLGFQPDKPIEDRSTRLNEPVQREFRSHNKVMPVTEAQLAIGLPIPGINHGDVAALDILSVILGQGASSRFETVIRRRLGVVSEIRSMALNLRDNGMFGVFATTQAEDIEAATKAILAEIDHITTKPISHAEFGRARTLLTSEAIYSHQTVDGIAKNLGFYCLHTNNIDYEAEYQAALAKLDPDQLLEVAKRYFVAKKMNITTVVPDPALKPPPKRLTWIRGRGKKKSVQPEKLNELLHRTTQGALKPQGRTGAGSSVTPRTTLKSLSSGDMLIVQTDPSSKLVSARLAFLGGQRREPSAKAGVANLLAAVLTRGTTTRSGDEVSRMMDTLACSISGFSGRNTLGLQGEFLASNFDQGFALFSDCLRQPALTPDEITREKELLIDEIRSNADNPSHLVFQLFARTIFQSHPYGRPIHGTESTVNTIDRQALSRYLATSTGSGGMVLTVVGGVDLEQVVELAERHLVRANGKPKKWKGPSPWRPPQQPVQATRTLPREQSHLVVGFPGTTFENEDRFTLEVLTEILGGHGGRLFATIREKLSLAYSVTAMSMEGIEPGYIALYCATSPGQEEQAVDALLREIETIRNKRPDLSETTRVKRHLIGARSIINQRGSARAAGMALGYLYGIGHDAAEKFSKQVQKVTPTMVADAANRYLDVNQMVISCVGPEVDQLNLTT